MSAIELLVCALTFRKATGAEYRAANPSDRALSGKSTISDSLRNYITWICAFFLLCYVGLEVALGGWLVDFMLRVRHGAPFASGLVAMGFWLGLAIGRITLGFITAYLGEKFAIATYLLGCMGLELCFWLIPNFISSAVFAALLGYFLGPMVPAAIVVATKLLPQRLHVSAIGFAAAFGGTGTFPHLLLKFVLSLKVFLYRRGDISLRCRCHRSVKRSASAAAHHICSPSCRLRVVVPSSRRLQEARLGRSSQRTRGEE